MAKLTVWLHQGTSIPSGHQQASLTSAFTGSDGRLTNDGWYEFLGTEAVIKADYKSVTGYAIDSFPQESSSSIGEGNYFGGADGNPDGES
mgnify:CR=1 FL=1